MQTDEKKADTGPAEAPEKYRLNLICWPNLTRLEKRRGWLYYGALTCWWGDDIYYRLPCKTGGVPGSPPLPCDPRSGVLMQVEPDKVPDFFKAARKNPDHYGKHGLDAFCAAFQGVVEVRTQTGWRPTCFRTWGEYNAVLDAHEAELLAFKAGLKPEKGFSMSPDDRKLSKDITAIQAEKKLKESFERKVQDLQQKIEEVAEKSLPPIMRFFEYDHLPPHLAEVSAPIGAVAKMMCQNLPSCAETSAGLRKLLEAKDCFVRARLETE